jgi:hypothetical protein
MKDSNISESEFIHRFDEYNRSNNFTYEGRQALYNYLTDLEEDTGQEMELDIIALCCEFDEYENVKEFLNSYYGKDEYSKRMEDLKDTFPDNYTEEDKEEDLKKEVFEELQNKTTLIEVDDDAFIIQAY